MVFLSMRSLSLVLLAATVHVHGILPAGYACVETSVTQTLNSAQLQVFLLALVTALQSNLTVFPVDSVIGNNSDDYVLSATNEIVLADCDAGHNLPAAGSKVLPAFREECEVYGELESTPSGYTLVGAASGVLFVNVWADLVEEVISDYATVPTYTRARYHAVGNWANEDFKRPDDPHLRHYKPCILKAIDSPLYADADSSLYDTNDKAAKCSTVTVGNSAVQEYKVVGHHAWSFANSETEHFYRHGRVGGMDIKIEFAADDDYKLAFIQDALGKKVLFKNDDYMEATVTRSGNTYTFIGRMLTTVDDTVSKKMEATTCVVLQHATEQRYAVFTDKPCFTWGFSLFKGSTNALVEVLPIKLTWSARTATSITNTHGNDPYFEDCTLSSGVPTVTSSS